MRKIILLLAFVVLCAGASVPLARPTIASAATPRTTAVPVLNDQPDVLVPAAQGPSVNKQLSNRAKSSWPWYITRASGLVAAFALVALMLSGIGFITGYTFKLLEPLTAWATHKALAYVFGVSVVIHVVALLFDTYVPFNIAQALLPFASNYQPVTIAGYHLGSLWVALGVFALYGVLAIIISSLLWIDKKPYTWKALHFLAYMVMIFIFFHALYIGTDLTHGMFRVLWILFSIGVAVAIVFRAWRRRLE